MPPAQGQVQAQGPGPAQKAAPVPAVSSLLPAASAPPGAWLPPAFWRPPRPFWHHQPTSACQASYRPRSYPQSLPRPACRQPWWCPFQLCRPSWCPWSAPALPWECCRGAYDTVFFPQAAQVSSRDSASANSQNRWFFFISLIPHKSAIRRGAFAPLRWLFCCYLDARFFRVSTTTAAAARAALPSHSTI